jgi:glycosyltransferase involved in cell wall biosynthesis
MNQLVSVIVITYNSAEFVIETLKSIQNQTYNNIELIITDDCSKDETVKVCNDWLLANKDRFAASKIIAVEQNTGVSANLKRGVDACTGEWIKIIAGDDLLLENCITDYIKASNEKYFDWAISKMNKLVNNSITPFENNIQNIKDFFSLDIASKYRYYLLNPLFLNPPSGFYRTSVLRDEGTIDVSFPLLEDQPIFLNLLKKNCEGIFLDLPTVSYRINNSSITRKINKQFYTNLLLCYQLHREPYFPDTIFGNIYKKSIKKRFFWLINSYSAKNKFEVLKNYVWEKLNIILSHLTFKFWK